MMPDPWQSECSRLDEPETGPEEPPCPRCLEWGCDCVLERRKRPLGSHRVLARRQGLGT
jgi:hypothetical protein